MTQKKANFKNIDKMILAIILIAAATVLAVLVSAYSSSMETGRNIGKTLGTLTGNLIGSYEGAKQGYEDGRYAALAPVIDIKETKEKIQGLGKLEVLVIKMEYLDVYKTDKTDNPNYAEVFTEEVSITYTVDLTKAIVETTGSDSIKITLPQIECSNPSPIEGTYNQKDWYQKSGNAGSTSEAIKQETASHKHLMDTIKEKANSTYMNLAKSAAQNQVTSLAKAMTGKTVTVEFIGG